MKFWLFKKEKLILSRENHRAYSYMVSNDYCT